MGADVDEQPSPTGLLGWLGFGLAVFSLACLGIAFASPYWFQTYPDSMNTFRNMGLWEVCFDNYMHHKDDSQEVYNGCWWVFNTEQKYNKLREWLLPPWFIAVQVLTTACLLIELGAVVACAAIFLHFCPIMNHEYHQTYAMFSVGALQLLAALVCSMSAIIYGTMCGDRQWMPRPDLNFMSWGFGFLIIFGIFVIASCACLFMEANKSFDELNRRDNEYTQAMLEMSQAQLTTMGTSYGAPSYGAPSYGMPEYDYADDKSLEPSDRKQSFGTQPSYGGQSSGGYDYSQGDGYNPGMPAKA